MPRLALAIAAALILHVVLLMIVVPEPRIEEPGIKGSGQVTVSIIHSIPETEPPEEAEEQSPPEIIEEAEQIIQDDPEVVPSELPIEEKNQEQETKEEVVQPKLPVKRFERSKINQKLARQSTKEQKKVEPVESKTSPFSSAVETLQDPRPIGQLNRPPEYPALARKRGWEGTVILKVDIGSDGMVKDIKLKQSSNYAILDKEARRAVRRWQFRPGSRGGKFVAVTVLVPVHFTLTDQ